MFFFSNANSKDQKISILKKNMLAMQWILMCSHISNRLFNYLSSMVDGVQSTVAVECQTFPFTPSFLFWKLMCTRGAWRFIQNNWTWIMPCTGWCRCNFPELIFPDLLIGRQPCVDTCIYFSSRSKHNLHSGTINRPAWTSNSLHMWHLTCLFVPVLR